MDSFTLNKIDFDAVRQILARFCSCTLGRQLAERISPSRNPQVINRWLRQVSQMVTAIRNIGPLPLAGVTDISEALDRARPGSGAGGEDFTIIASSLQGAANVRNYLNALPEELDLLHESAGGIGDFDGEVRAIFAVVDPDGTVRDDASSRLGEIRRQIAATTRQIHDAIYGYLRQPEVARLLQDAVVTLHGDRYVLPVKAENRGRLPGVVHRESNTGATVFVEPNASVELNNRLTDLSEDERREIQRLLGELSLHIQRRRGEIDTTMQALGQLDLVSAKAEYSCQFDLTCPDISETGALQFSGARHPLLIEQQFQQEKAGLPADKRHPVVPIDVRLGADFDLLVITGSNTGGKTVALKTVALLAVMAQSGMHIPVQRGSRMPAFRDVLIDVGDEQSLQQSLSTFGAHIKRIKHIIRKADKASLVLLDELGAGTDPDEGGAIGQAVLDELRRIGCLGMATTHLSVLKAYAFTHDRVDNASVDFDTTTLSPTYRLRIGTPGESHAITVAQKLGVLKRMVAAARKHLNAQGKQFRRAIRSTGVVRRQAEDARTEARKAQLAAQDQQECYEAKLADLHRLREQFQAWLATLGELKVGDEVVVPKLNKAGKLARLELHRQVAVVNVDQLQVEVPLHELMPDLGQEQIREQIDGLRKQILDQARSSRQEMDEVQHMRQELHLSLKQQKLRARQFDAWLGAISRLKVGDEVTIARKPGKGKVLEVNLPGLRATVQTSDRQMELSLQELFPQTGPFVRREVHPRGAGRPKSRRGKPADRNRPMTRRSPTGKAAKANREKLLAVEPGKQVFIIPFNKRATLIRINPEKDQAVVQSGVFEMELPISDLELVHNKE
ncbi:MAG: MutS2/Smr-associated SH3 domain-containing protein [Planctomycetota bacterium]|nr:MutS2/Smr-associated SH3 domain-containing protein [Planctomycetota bacterium]